MDKAGRVSFPWQSADDSYDRQDQTYIEELMEAHQCAKETMNAARELEQECWPSHYAGLVNICVKDSLVVDESGISTLLYYARQLVIGALAEQDVGGEICGGHQRVLRPCLAGGSKVCWRTMIGSPEETSM